MYRIFIVEDDPTMANAMKEKIESWGNEARIVEHFQNVMTEFTAYDPHLVLMDIMLPFFQWISLVYADPPDFASAGCILIVSF